MEEIYIYLFIYRISNPQWFTGTKYTIWKGRWECYKEPWNYDTVGHYSQVFHGRQTRIPIPAWPFTRHVTLTDVLIFRSIGFIILHKDCNSPWFPSQAAIRIKGHLWTETQGMLGFRETLVFFSLIVQGLGIYHDMMTKELFIL